MSLSDSLTTAAFIACGVLCIFVSKNSIQQYAASSSAITELD
jgi:hypothetical protein